MTKRELAEQVLAASSGGDNVAPKVTFPEVLNYIDMGAFIVQLKLAQDVGFNSDAPAADGYFAEDCLAECQKRGLKPVYIPKLLFIHN